MINLLYIIKEINSFKRIIDRSESKQFINNSPNWQKKINVEENIPVIPDKNIIDHPSFYTNKDLFIARGSWGEVYKAYYTESNSYFAIKILKPSENAKNQLEYRCTYALNILHREALTPSFMNRVVPRRLFLDLNDKPFIVMPYLNFLNDEKRKSLGMGLNLSEVIRGSNNLLLSINEVHNLLDCTHNDIKPENIAITDYGDLILSDFGIASKINLEERSKNPRDNMGFILTRAPECFIKGAHPDKRSDLWSIGAVIFMMFSGKYPLEGIIRDNDPIKFINELGSSDGNNIIKNEIKNNIPEAFSLFLEGLLSFYPHKRFRNALVATKKLHKILKNIFHDYRKYVECDISKSWIREVAEFYQEVYS